MNTKDIAYFIKLTEIKSFSKVANTFGVSQPTVSFALKRLEEELGTTLIVRFRAQKTLRVTASGQQFLVHARRILDELKVASQEITDQRLKHLTLGLPPIIENNYFPQIAKALKQRALLRKIQTQEAGSTTMLTELRSGEIDLALLGTISPLSDAEIETETFGRQSFAIFVAKDHPLATQKQVRFADLKHEDFVLFKDGFVHNQAVSLLAKRNHLKPNVVFRSNDMHSLMNLIANGVGIGFLTAGTAPVRSDVVKLDLADEDLPQFIVSIAYRRTHVFNPLQQAILDVIRQTLRGDERYDTVQQKG